MLQAGCASAKAHEDHSSGPYLRASLDLRGADRPVVADDSNFAAVRARDLQEDCVAVRPRVAQGDAAGVDQPHRGLIGLRGA